MTPQAVPKIRSRGLRYTVTAALVLILAYMLTGFLLAPWFAKRELPRLVEEKFHQRARIGEIAFNPFTLTLHVKDFALEEMAGWPVFGFSDATVDLAWRSLLRRGWVLSEVRVVNPSLHVEISKQGRVNLASLAPNTPASEHLDLLHYAASTASRPTLYAGNTARKSRFLTVTIAV